MPTKAHDEWIPICPGCLHENPPAAPFCHDCGMPIGMITTIDPIQQIYATGWIYRRAIAGGRWPLALWGMLLIFAPNLVFWIVAFAFIPSYTPKESFSIEAGIGFGLSGLSALLTAAILFRVVHGYVQHLRLRPGMCNRCGYNLSHLVEPRCPECGTQFDPDDVQDAMGDCEEEIETPSDSLDPSAKEFPVDCEACGAPLSGEAYSGTCAACGAAFNRRDRVVDAYGPEAFLPDKPKPAKARGGRSRFRRAIILTIVSLASIPLAYTLVDWGVLQSDRLPFLFFLFVGVGFEWFRVFQIDPQPEKDDDSPPNPV